MGKTFGMFKFRISYADDYGDDVHMYGCDMTRVKLVSYLVTRPKIQ